MEVRPFAPANLRPRLQHRYLTALLSSSPLQALSFPTPRLVHQPAVTGPSLDDQSPSYPTPAIVPRLSFTGPTALLPCDRPALVTRAPPPSPTFSHHSAPPLSAGLSSSEPRLLLEALLQTEIRSLLPGPASAGPPGPAFFAAPVVLLDPTSRVDGEPHVDATPVPRVQAVEQVDAEEAPGPCRVPRRAHRDLWVDCWGL